MTASSAGSDLEQAHLDALIASFGAQHGLRPDQLLPLLHEVQRDLGCVPDAAVRAVAGALNVSRADVHGVVTFYHDFRSEPGGCVIEVCGAEACQAVGCRALLEHARASAQGRRPAVTVDEVFCLGNCASGPSVRIGDRVFGRVTTDRFDELVADLRGRS